jgi:large subunit ribosomal protein L29
MIKVEELRNLSGEELKEKASSLKKELMQYRFQSKTGKLEQQNVLKQVRRDIARVLTIMNEKSVEGRSARLPAKRGSQPAPKAEAVKKPSVKSRGAK